jgi:hypothetical protein
VGLSCRSLLCRIGIQAPSKRSLDPLAVCSLIMTLLSPAYRSLSDCIDFNWDCLQSCLWIFLRCCHRVHVVHSHRLFLICHGGSIRKRSINRCFFPCMKMIRQNNHYFSQYIGIFTFIVKVDILFLISIHAVQIFFICIFNTGLTQIFNIVQ